MISTSDLHKGVVIELDGDLWQILDYHHLKIGRGSAQVRIKLRNVKRGQTVERSFQAGDRWPRAQIDHRQIQFMYQDGSDYHFMETESYEQFSVSAEQLDDAVNYLKDGMLLDRTSYEGETIGVELPVTVDLQGRRNRARFRGRHPERRTQAGEARDGTRHPGADLRRRRRHHPGGHSNRGIPDASLISEPGMMGVFEQRSGR